MRQEPKRKLIKKGAEADIFLISWFKEKAISKLRKPKPYRNALLDSEIRKKRTIHEANMLSATKIAKVTVSICVFCRSHPRRGHNGVYRGRECKGYN